MRNLDVTTLRSFVAVADLGGVTKAAGFLHLTQSAVSMQLKRLEELLGVSLLDRSGRSIALTSPGEQLLGYARRMVTLNDEVMRRLTHDEFEGEITLGVPHDVVYPVIPRAMQQFAQAYPRIKVHLIASNTKHVKPLFDRGECDLILTTEGESGAGAERLCTLPLAWIGAPGGAAWRRRPFRLAQSQNCIFRARAVRALDQAGIDWEMAVDTDSDRTIEATTSADLGIMVMIEGTEPPQLEVVEHSGALPDLGHQHINMYGAETGKGEVIGYLADLLRRGFQSGRGLAEQGMPVRLSSIS